MSLRVFAVKKAVAFLGALRVLVVNKAVTTEKRENPMNDPYIHLYQPPKNGSDRTLILLHGTGGTEHDLLSVAEYVDPDAAVLSLRGDVKEGQMNRFFRRLAEGVFDMEDLRRAVNKLNAFLPAAAEQYGFDLSKAVALGYSNGANLLAAQLLTGGFQASGAALLRPMVPLEPTATDLTGKRIFLAGGEADNVTPIEHVDRLQEIFERLGAEVTVSIARAGHNLTRGDLEAARMWLNA